MIRNEIDEFRRKFFEDFVRVEQEKANELKRVQRNCFHVYQVINGTIECKKCGAFSKRSDKRQA